jgi:hypothetical protein
MSRSPLESLAHNDLALYHPITGRRYAPSAVTAPLRTKGDGATEAYDPDKPLSPILLATAVGPAALVPHEGGATVWDLPSATRDYQHLRYKGRRYEAHAWIARSPAGWALEWGDTDDPNAYVYNVRSDGTQGSRASEAVERAVVGALVDAATAWLDAHEDDVRRILVARAEQALRESEERLVRAEEDFERAALRMKTGAEQVAIDRATLATARARLA